MAEGFVLSIDDSMLKKLDEADAKIEKLQQTSEKTSASIIDSFKKMATGVQPFIEKLSEAQSLLSKMAIPKLSNNGLKEISTDGEKAAKAVADISVALNRTKANPIDEINKKISSLKDLLAQSTKAAEDYANKMASIKSTGSGFISGITIKESGAGKSLIPQIQAEIAVLEQEKKSILSSQLAWKQRIESINNSSLASQRQVSEMNKLNESFRSGISETQKQAKAIDSTVDSLSKMMVALDKAANAQSKFNEKSKVNADNNAAKAEEQYERALNKTEVTIANRARKIEALANAERALLQTGRSYSTEINKIRTETERLNKANEEAAKSIGNIKKNQRNLIDTSAQLERKLALLFSVSQIEGYIMKLVNIRGEFELQNRALQAILQNKDEANKLFEQITELAIRSPFRVKELVTYTKELAAYRIETEKLYDTTKMLADVSAGLGVDMSRLILAYGQVKAANYLRGTELRQFSEAGINILGELSTYFTELEGRVVSVGDVFERVTKRMVSFGDVEEIFKRITSAGGIFYNMQEIQAETLQGQISNLYDSIDIMFNEIGKANDGILKDSVSIIKSLIENWEILANVLKAAGVGFTLYTAKAIIATAANKGFTASQIEATIASGGLTKALAKTGLAFKNIGMFLKANPFIILASIVSAGAFALIDHNKKLDEARAKYDILTDSLSRQKKEFSEIVSKIKDQNEIISKSAKIMTNLSKDTSEYTKAQEDNNRASKQRNFLLEELRTKYPQIYNGLVQQKDGTVDLTLAQEKYNKQLEQTNYLNFLAKQTETFFNSGLIENAKKMAEAQSVLNKENVKVTNSWTQLSNRLNVFLSTNKNISEDVKKQFSDIANSSLSASAKMNQTYSLAQRLRIGDVVALRKLISEYRIDTSDLAKANFNFIKIQQELSSQIKSVAADVKATYDLTTEEGKAQAAESLRIFMESIGIQEKAVKDFITQRFEVIIGVKIAEAPIINQYSGIQKSIKDFIERNQLSVDIIKPDQSSTEYFNKLKADVKDSAEYIEKLKTATEQLEPGISNIEVIAREEAKLADARKVLSAYGEKYQKGEKGISKIFSERIGLIKEVNSEYEKLLKNYNKEDAANKIRSAYSDSWKELFASTPMEGTFATMEFDVSGAITALETLLQTASKETRLAAQKALDGLRARVDLDVTVQRTEEIRADIEKLFSGYELSIELEKLNIPPELAKDLFNVDVFNLDELKKKVKPYLAQLRSEGSEQIKIAEDIEKKISDMEHKYNVERLKNYSVYLKKSMSERVAIELETLRKIEDINKIKEFSPEQKQTAISNVKKEQQKKIDKKDWEDFRSSDLYIRMFEDLEAVSTRTLDLMESKLIELKNSLKTLSPTELKEIQTQLGKIREIKVERNPFKGLITGLREYIKLLGDKGKLDKAYIQSVSDVSFNTKQVELQEKELALAEKRLAIAKANVRINEDGILVGQEEVKKEEEKIAVILKNLSFSKKSLEIAKKQNKELGDQKDNLDQANKTWRDSLAEIGSTFTSMSSSIGEVAGSLENVFGTMSGGMADAVDSTQEILGGIGEIATGIAKGGIEGYMQATVGLFKTIGAIFAIGDKKKERQIQRELGLVENLEKAYKKLEKAIDNAYSLDSLQEANKNAEQNLRERIEATERAIAAEEDKKKTDNDRVKELRENIEAYKEQLKELEEQRIEALGGFGSEANYKSAAEEFANAWYEAYKETGDGLSGLEDTFDSFIDNIVKKQLLLRGTEQLLKPLLEMIDGIVDDGIVDIEEKNKLDKQWLEQTKPALDALYKAIAESMGIIGGEGEKELSGLQKGIEGITETTAEALEALLNSVRFFVSDSNSVLKSIYNLFSNADIPNPILSELQAQTMVIRNIYDLFNGMTAPHPTLGGRGLKSVI